jgi:nucleotidyltransferase AbiEii toxin of type IV toxin-antitoxin system
MAASQTEVMIKVIEALEDLDSAYLIGGSYASSAHGIARATMDIDILAAIPAKQATAFAEKLAPEFYADEQAIRNAIMAKRSFNVIHIETMFKVDVFVSKRDSFDKQQLERRELYVAVRNPDRSVYVASPEDTILSKLRWYRQTDETSDRQWNDVLGVMSVQAEKLDLAYLKRWADELSVSDLLESALTQSQIEPN